MARIIVPALVGLLISGSAWAYDSSGGYANKFPYTCEQVTKFHETAGLEQKGQEVTFKKGFGVIIGWMAGYMSRINYAERGRTDFFRDMSSEVVWVTSWCKKNPLANLPAAMEALVEKRVGKK